MIFSRQSAVLHLLCDAGLVIAALGLSPAAAAVPAGSPPGKETQLIHAARVKFDRVIALEAQANWTAALDLLHEIAAVRRTPEVVFHIAHCHEHLGQLVLARTAFEEALSKAHELGTKSVIYQASQRLTRLDVRIPRLLVRRGQGAYGAEIFLDGEELDGTQVGRFLPLDPGTHRIEARRQGYVSFVTKIELGLGQVRELSLTLRPDRGNRRPTPLATQNKQKHTPWAYFAGGAGLISLAAAGTFYLLRQGAVETLEQQCDTDRLCPREAQRSVDNARLYTELGNATLIAGIAGIGIGASLFFFTGDGQEATIRRDAKQNQTVLRAGFSVSGRF